MRSLRSRLILGSALIAVVPLAVAMALLSQRVGAMVRAQAVERLNAALGGLEAQLQIEGARVGEQLQSLGKDPTLKRLFLVRPPGDRELDEYLSDRRRLLGLGFLRVVDGDGAVAAEATAPDSAAAPVTRASAPILYQDAPVGSVSGGLLLDAAYLERLKQTSGVDLALRDSLGAVLASTLPGLGSIAAGSGGEVARVEISGRSYLGRGVTLGPASAPGLAVIGLVSTGAADRTILALQLASLLLGLAGLVLAVVLGMMWSSQVSGPVEELAAFSRRLSQGDWEEPLAIEGVRELEVLVEALDRMRRDLLAYRARLVVSERQAAWSQMARKVAHEIKNPLTPIAISVADLKRSYELRRPDFPEILEQAVRTVAEEVQALQRMLQEFSDFARLPAPRPARCRVDDLLRDLETLYGHEIAEGRLVFSTTGSETALTVDGGQIKQALINLIKNGLEALEGAGRVEVSAAVRDRVVEFAVANQGRGLSAEQRAHLFVPGFTTKSEGSGLGLTIVERIVSDHRGTIAVEDGPAGGTVVRVRLPFEPRS